jgi:hypothetical protein
MCHGLVSVVGTSVQFVKRLAGLVDVVRAEVSGYASGGMGLGDDEPCAFGKIAVTIILYRSRHFPRHAVVKVAGLLQFAFPHDGILGDDFGRSYDGKV